MVLVIKKDVFSKRKYLMCLFWAFQLIIRRITALIMTILGMIDYVEVLNAFFWAVVIVFCLNAVAESLKLKDILFGLLVFAFSYIALVIWPFNYYINQNRYEFFSKVFPFFFLGRCIAIDKEILDDLRQISIVTIIINYVVYFLYYKQGGGTGIFHDNLAFAYDIIPHVILLFYYFLKNKKLKDSIFFFLAAILLVIQGSRAPVLYLVVFFIWYSFSFQPFLKWILKSSVLLVLFFTFVQSGLLDYTLNFLVNFGNALGIGTRIFDEVIKIRKVGLAPDFWRTYLRDIVLKGIYEKPIRGFGPYGDYYLTRNDTHFINGMYVHNIFIELMCDYGIIIGILLFIVLFVLLFKAYNSSEGIEVKLIILILSSNTIYKLFFSGSYLKEPYFFFMLGVLISLIDTAKKRKAKCLEGNDG